MRDYELVVLLDPDLEIDVEKPISKVEKIVEADAKGKVTSKDVWGKRKLAYTISKKDYAIYVLFLVQLPAEGVAELERVLNITDEVIRYIVTNPVPEVEGLADEKRDEKDDKKSKTTDVKEDKQVKEEE